MSAPKTLKFGVIGLGLMGKEFASCAARWLHLKGTKLRPEIIAVCDRSPEARAWFEEAIPGLKQSTADYKELLANPEVEAIYCAVPHNLHRELYLDIIKSGKHLLGEKPFGIDEAANQAIIDAIAQAKGLVVRCSSEFPFFPGAQRLVSDIRTQDFGQIIEVNAGFSHSSDLDPEKAMNWKRQVATNGEYGCMGDLGMHVLHLPLRLGWFPSRVSAVLSRVFEKRPDGKGGMAVCETWDNAQIQCQVEPAKAPSFPMTLKTQRIAPGETDTWHIEVRGTKRSAGFSTKFPKTYRYMEYKGGAQAWAHEDLGYTSAYPAITGHIFEFGFSDALLQMWAAFCDEVAGTPKDELPFSCVTPEETRQCHQVLTAALNSHKEGKTVLLKA